MYKTAEAIKLAGGKITREPGPVPGIKTKITLCVDPDGWKTVCFFGHFKHYFHYDVYSLSYSEAFVLRLTCTCFFPNSNVQVFVDNVDFRRELE